MYTAILNFKSGQVISIQIPEILNTLYHHIPEIIYKPEEYIELTPDNIINKGGFSCSNIHSSIKKAEFYLFSVRNYNMLYYQEI